MRMTVLEISTCISFENFKMDPKNKHILGRRQPYTVEINVESSYYPKCNLICTSGNSDL